MSRSPHLPPQAARDLAVRERRGTGASGAGRATPTEGRGTTPGGSGGGRGAVRTPHYASARINTPISRRFERSTPKQGGSA